MIINALIPKTYFMKRQLLNAVKKSRTKKHLTQKALVKASQIYYFSISQKYSQFFDQRLLTDELRQLFYNKGFVLSEEAYIKVKKETKLWSICDKCPKFFVKMLPFGNMLDIHDAGISESTVRRLEKNTTQSPRPRTMKKVAEGADENEYRLFRITK